MKKFEVDKYKFDDRSREEFIADLSNGLKKEVRAINVFKEILCNSKIDSPEVVYVGSDKEGEVLYTNNEVANVSIFPDYLAKYRDGNRRARYKFIEVKTCENHSRFAYFKKKQILQYDELSNVIILFVMGIEKDDPKFILVSPKQILNLGIEPELIYGKETYRVDASRFSWEELTPKVRDYDVIAKNYIRKG
jgi:hypothetical protein